MKELEANYGIYLDVDIFIKEMNQKFNEIKSLSEMYEYIGSEYGKDLTDLEIIIKSYKRAKLKGYIHGENNTSNFNRSQNFRGGYNKGRGRGRGDFRGKRGGRGTGRGRGNRGGH